MDVNVNRNMIEDIPQEEYSIGFEVEKTPIRLGKSDRFIYMDFNDTNFPARLMQGREEIANFLEEKRKELGIEDISQLQAKEYTLEEIEKTIAISNEIDSFIKNKVNYMFGYDISKEAFGIASSVSVTRKGEYYFDSFLNSILPLVEREYQVRIQASNERIRKYTDKKGLHPALKK